MKKFKMFFMLSLLASCSRGGIPLSQQLSITIVNPEEIKNKTVNTSKIKKISKSAPSWGVADPATIGEFNCFGIFITYPEKTHANSCTDSSSTIIAAQDDGLGFVGSGETLTAEILYGTNRRFQVVAFKSTLSTCPVFPGDWDDATEAGLSYPFIVGDIVMDVGPSTTEVTINLTFDDVATPRIYECQGPLFDYWKEESSVGIWDYSAWGSATWGQ